MVKKRNPEYLFYIPKCSTNEKCKYLIWFDYMCQTSKCFAAVLRQRSSSCRLLWLADQEAADSRPAAAQGRRCAAACHWFITVMVLFILWSQDKQKLISHWKTLALVPKQTVSVRWCTESDTSDSWTMNRQSMLLFMMYNREVMFPLILPEPVINQRRIL